MERTLLKGGGCGGNAQRFWQEIYDERGRLVEVHEKYPVDRGHEKV
jgi:hypothetical protein